MKTLAVILLPLLCAAADAPVGIDAVLDAARAAPAEFAADAMIRIAALGQLEKARRIELLEQAFQRASGAQQPYKRHATFVRPDSPAVFLNRAYGLDLDAMSLRLRAIEGLLPLDAPKARDLFLQTPPPKTPPLKCDDFLIYDVGRFYDTLGSIARQSFTAQEAQAGEPFRLLERLAGAITSPVQVAPVARMLAAASVKDADFRAAVDIVRGGTGQDFGPTGRLPIRCLWASRFWRWSRSRAAPVVAAAAAGGHRLYLVNNLSAARCADDDSMTGNALSLGHWPASRLSIGRPRTPWGSSIDTSAGRRYNRFRRKNRRLPGWKAWLSACACARTPNAAPSRNSAGGWPWAKTAWHTRPSRRRRRHGARRFGTFSRPCPGGRRAPLERSPPPPSTSA